jgi:hypothetical protein
METVEGIDAQGRRPALGGSPVDPFLKVEKRHPLTSEREAGIKATPVRHLGTIRCAQHIKRREE